MFKPNNQPKLLTFENELGDWQRQQLNKTREKWFYHLIFRNINERDFKPLFSDKDSRPNAPVNVLVSAIILKEIKSWSYDELIDSVLFDLRTKVALGLSDIDEKPFSRATIFNFQNRLQAYEQETGINLIEMVFNNLTADQIKKLEVKTNIQRSDSTLIGSNIRNYSRLQLLIEALLRLYRILTEEDKQRFSEQVKGYHQKGSEKYVYEVKSDDLPREIGDLGNLYKQLYDGLQGKYNDTYEWQIFERVFQEHFVVVEEKATARPSELLGSDCLQSPDDWDAAYRKKRDEEVKGYSYNVTETAHPDNSIQLISDVATAPCNTEDSTLLNQRIGQIKEKTPDLEEMHTDGGYGSPEIDQTMEEEEVLHVTTAVKGRESQIQKTIEKPREDSENYLVSCPRQTVESTPTKKKNKAVFDSQICSNCELKDQCSIYKQNGRFYFTHGDYLKNRRNRNIDKIPLERRKIRPNVEATMREFTIRAPGNKLKVRGRFKASLFAFAVAIGVNFGRIYRYIRENYPCFEKIKAQIDAIINNLFSFWYFQKRLRVLQVNFSLQMEF
ncbi:MAG: transposase [Bacteroidales bacterium]|nr:transposase [Bacteroidales bacterium]